MPASAEIYFEHDRLGRALAWSAGLHVATIAFLVILGCMLRPLTFKQA